MNMTPRLAVARRNMVENQVRPWEVLDARVLDALSSLPREDFVPSAYRELAYADVSLPLGYGEVMLKPVLEGRALQALAPTGTESVLEIGTGSGYFAACLARLGKHVTSVDHREAFVTAARARWQAAGCANIDGVVADALDGFAPGATFDVIAITGAVTELPARIGDWLAPNGRVFAIRGREPAMQAVLLRRAGDGGWFEERLFETVVPYLAGAAPAPRFTL